MVMPPVFTPKKIRRTDNPNLWDWNLPPGWETKTRTTSNRQKIEELVSRDQWRFSDFIVDDSGNVSDFVAHSPEGRAFFKQDYEALRRGNNVEAPLIRRETPLEQPLGIQPVNETQALQSSLRTLFPELYQTDKPDIDFEATQII